MITVLLLGPARDAAGAATMQLRATTVHEVRAALVQRFGPGFASVLDASRIWVDGEPADGVDPVPDGAEVSILPPVSGG